MNTTLDIDLSTALPSPGTPRPAAESTDPVGELRALSERELVDLAERHDASGDQPGLDAARDEAERRAHHQDHDQDPGGLAAQIAGYLGLLAEDTEHALADEAHTWSRELHRALAANPSVPAPRSHAEHRAVRS